MKQCDFQNNYGTVAYRKVCSCAPIFNFLYGPSGFFLRGKFIPKIAPCESQKSKNVTDFDSTSTEC